MKINKSNFKRRALKITEIFFSQIFITAVNTISSILLLRFLPLDEFSLYTLGTTYISILVTCSDMGISQSLVSIGVSKNYNNNLQISLTNDGLNIRKKLFLIFCILLTFIIYYSNISKLNSQNFVLIIASILIISYLQGIIQIKKTIFITNFNTRISFKIGLMESVSKLVFLPFCYYYPNIFIALFGLIFSSIFTLIYINNLPSFKYYFNKNINNKNDIYKFIKPLIPVVIFTVIQGNIGVLFLNELNNKIAVAQYGALSRISMLFSTLLIINTYIIQPYFAKINSLSKFKNDLLKLLIIFILFSTTVLISVFLFSNIWLLILGEKYSNLSFQLLLIVINSLLNLLGALIYTITISKKYTKGQSYYIIFGVIIQLCYYSFFKIKSINDVLYINIILSITYLFIQLFFLKKSFKSEF